MCKNGAALFCKFASPWRKTLQVACMASVACTWGSLPTLCNWKYSTFTARLSVTYTQTLSCAQGRFSHPLLTHQTVCTDNVSTIWRPQYSKWLPNFGLANSFNKYPESEGQKGGMTSWYALRDVKLPCVCMRWKLLQLLIIYDSIREGLHYLGTVPNTRSNRVSGS
jgi:hypothetical protein